MMIAATTLCTAALVVRPAASVGTYHRFKVPVRHKSVRSSAASAIDALERKATAASEAWDTAVTAFVDADLVAAAEDRLQGQDVGVLKVSGYAGASRSRFVFTNPELLDSLDKEELAAEHSILLRVAAAFDKKGNRFGAGGKLIPNLLDGIGVGFDQLGDVTFDEGKGGEGGVAYIVCDPAVQKTIERLLPKSLGRASIDAMEPGFKPTGSLVEMAVGRLDKREYK